MILVVNYHYFREPEDSFYPGIHGVSQSRFQAQIEFLCRHFEPLESSDFEREIAQFKDGNYFFVTFDDGLKEQYEIAKPILDRNSIRATYFVNGENFVENRASLVHKVHWLKSQVNIDRFIELVHDRLEEYGIVPALSLSDFNPVEGQNIYDNVKDRYAKYLLNHTLSLVEQVKVIDSIYNSGGYNEKEHVENLYFNKEILKELGENNSLGSHGYRHDVKTTLSQESLVEDIDKNLDFLRTYSPSSKLMVSYPFGGRNAVSKEVADIHRSKGLVAGFTMERALNNSSEDKLVLCRLDANDIPLGKYPKFEVFNNVCVPINGNELNSKWFN